MEHDSNAPLDVAVEHAIEIPVKTEPESEVAIEYAERQPRPKQVQGPNAPTAPIVSSDTIENGAVFKNRPEFLKVLEEFSNKTYQPFRKASSETHRDLVTKRKIPGYEYKTEVYQCVLGGKARKRGKGERPNQKYLPKECPARIRVNLKHEIPALVITTCNLKHNHPLTPDLLDKKARRKYAKTVPDIQKRAASEAGSSSEAASSGESGTSREAGSSSESSQLGVSNELQNRISASLNFAAFLQNLFGQVPTPIAESLLRQLLTMNSVAQPSAVAANPSPDAIDTSFVGANVKTEPVDLDQASAVNTLVPEGMNSFIPCCNVKVEPTESHEDGGTTENQENEQPGFDNVDLYVNEFENFAPLNDLKAMQEIVDSLHFIRNDITY